MIQSLLRLCPFPYYSYPCSFSFSQAVLLAYPDLKSLLRFFPLPEMCSSCYLHSSFAHLHVFTHSLSFHCWPLPVKSTIDHIFLNLQSFPPLPRQHLQLLDLDQHCHTHCVSTCLSSASLSLEYKVYEVETLAIWVTAMSLAPKQYLRLNIYSLKE